MELASKLHKQREQKPFSISPLLEGHELKEGYSFIYPGKEVVFKLTMLNEKMLASAISALFSTMVEEKILYLSKKPVTIESIDLCEEKSYSKLLTNTSTELTITLEFITPTSFKAGSVQALFPEPKLIFSSLLKRWNAFSEIKLSEECAENFASIKVSKYNLHTELVYFSRYKVIGFKGRIEYKLPQESSEPFQQVINALANFASYAGVGVKTAMGMGQTKRISLRGESGRACS